jgi:hypothetical protein
MAKSKRDRRTPPKRSGPAVTTTAGTDASGGNGSAVQVSNRQSRKEQARREREALRRKVNRRRIYRRVGIIVLALAVAAGIATGVLVANTGSKPTGTLAGLQTGPQPWIAETQDLIDRLDAIGFQCLPQEGNVIHIHQHLDVFVDGQPVTVPQQIGIRSSPQCFSPIHTHTPDGTIHVESPTQRTFTLGEVFDVWGVRFSPRCLGGYCNQGDKALRVFVDGKRVTGNPRDLKLASHQEIVVAYGTEKELPEPIPSSFTFQQGE